MNGFLLYCHFTTQQDNKRKEKVILQSEKKNEAFAKPWSIILML